MGGPPSNTCFGKPLYDISGILQDTSGYFGSLFSRQDVMARLGDRPTAGLQTLDLPIEVRILVPQPAVPGVI